MGQVPTNEWGVNEAFKTLEQLTVGSSSAVGAMAFLRRHIEEFAKPPHEREPPHCASCACPPYQPGNTATDQLLAAEAMFAALKNLPCGCVFDHPYEPRGKLKTQCARCRSMAAWTLATAKQRQWLGLV